MLQDYIQKLYAPDLRLFFTLNKYSLNKRLKKTAAAGVKTIRVHDLRHSHASLLIELGFSPLLISQRLGHEKVETTLQTYSHLEALSIMIAFATLVVLIISACK